MMLGVDGEDAGRPDDDVVDVRFPTPHRHRMKSGPSSPETSELVPHDLFADKAHGPLDNLVWQDGNSVGVEAIRMQFGNLREHRVAGSMRPKVCLSGTATGAAEDSASAETGIDAS